MRNIKERRGITLIALAVTIVVILKEEDVAFLSQSAYADACCPGNPRDTSEEEIAQLYKSLL